jgi:hypothetical protein
MVIAVVVSKDVSGVYGWWSLLILAIALRAASTTSRPYSFSSFRTVRGPEAGS